MTTHETDRPSDLDDDEDNVEVDGSIEAAGTDLDATDEDRSETTWSYGDDESVLLTEGVPGSVLPPEYEAIVKPQTTDPPRAAEGASSSRLTNITSS